MSHHNDVIFCLHELCHSHTKKSVLFKFLGEKKDGELNEFVQNIIRKKWSVSSIKDLLRKIDKTGSVERKPGSRRPWSIRTQRYISRVSELICSQEDNPGISKSPRNIEKVTGISRSSVRHIVKQNLQLNVFRCKMLSDTDR